MYLSSDIVSASIYNGPPRSAYNLLSRYKRELVEGTGSGNIAEYNESEGILFLAFLDHQKTMYKSYSKKVWQRVLNAIEDEMDYILIDKKWQVEATREDPRNLTDGGAYTVIYRPALLDRLKEARSVRTFCSTT